MGELPVELQTGPDTDAEELAELVGGLRAELLELDVGTLQQPVCGVAPEDSKGGGLLGAGALVVRFVASPEVLMSIIRGIRLWLGRNRVRSVKITPNGDALDGSGVSSAEQDQLIDLWVAPHATGA